MTDYNSSIFRRYFKDESFKDRLNDSDEAFDVIIPILHTNELWRANLFSIYREIPVNRLLLGDAGCIDDSISIARQFPRVVVHNHKHIMSLGYSLRKLIEAVETKWFIYLHSDVYIPPGWLTKMMSHRAKYDWFECRQQITTLIEFPIEYDNPRRALSGSQVGCKAAFMTILPMIDDDYLYRNEDIILGDLVERAGFRWGRVEEAFHYHQVMATKSPWHRQIKDVRFKMELSPEEEFRTYMMQAKGIIKYMNPDTTWIVSAVENCICHLIQIGELDLTTFRQWIRNTNPQWLPVLSFRNKMKLLVKGGYGTRFRAWLAAGRQFLRASIRLVLG